MIAQAVQKCAPELVSDTGEFLLTSASGITETIEHTLNVDYGRVTAILINAVHDLKADNDNIRAANDNLRAEIEARRAIAR